jgi:hypothetical protein
MAGFSLLVRRETIRRIASSGSNPTEGFENSSLVVMVDGVNAAIDGLSQGFAEACRWAIQATTKAVDDAVRGVDVVALRVAQEISPVWYRMTPQARVTLLGVGVTVSPTFSRLTSTVGGCLDVTTVNNNSLLFFIRFFSLGSFICATLSP